LRTPGVDDYNVVDFNNTSFMPSSAKIVVTWLKKSLLVKSKMIHMHDTVSPSFSRDKNYSECRLAQGYYYIYIIEK
jgi:hypothetical protein